MLLTNITLLFFFIAQSQVAAKGRELKELKDSLAALSKEKEKLEGVRVFIFIF